MKRQCIRIFSPAGNDRRCKNEAEFIVERNDLSHRKGEYCKECAEPYKEYPNDFIVRKIES